MSDTKKPSRAEARAEIARRMGYYAQNQGIPGAAWYLVAPGYQASGRWWNTEAEAWLNSSPDFFADRNAAADVVAWVTRHKQAYEFVAQLAQVMSIRPVAAPTQLGTLFSDVQICSFLRATPEQITLAAMAALGIEVEQ